MENETEKILSVFCFDCVSVEDRFPLCSFIFQGIQMTYWLEEATNTQKVIDNIFDILFEEVLVKKSSGET